MRRIKGVALFSRRFVRLVLKRYISHVWGGFGPFVAAHEYGHAVHHTALGGLDHFDLCPIPHFVQGAHNFGCAVKEGFANWHAIVVMAEVPHLSWRTEVVADGAHPWFTEFDEDLNPVPGSESDDGAIVEGAVAKFFLEVGDLYSGSYVAQILSTCEVKNSSWEPADGIDHLTFCFEEQIDAAVTGSSIFFPARGSHASDFQHSACLPGGWDATEIRTWWTSVLYPDS